MAYLGPKNKIKIKSSKPDEFIYYDDKTSFNGSYLETSRGEFYEGDDVDNPGRVLIPFQKNKRKFDLLALLKTLLALAASVALILQVLEELKKISNDLAEIAEFQNMINELLSIPEGESLSEQNISNLNNSFNQFSTSDFSVSDNIVVHDGVYNDIKTNIYNKLNSNKSPISLKVRPTDQDYINGSYMRYFAKRINSFNYYIEIDKNTYNSINKKNKTFDTSLYTVSKIKWNLSTSAREININNLNRYKKPFPNIELLFNDPIEYAPVGRSNLDSPSDAELYYIDGTPYIGPYHVHPIKGPMVGATHTAEPHDNLYYEYELGQPIEELQTNINEEDLDILGLVSTHVHSGATYKFYVKENKLGIFIEVTGPDPENELPDGTPTTVFISDIFDRNSITVQQLVDLAKQELGLQSGPPESTYDPDNPKPEDPNTPSVSYINENPNTENSPTSPPNTGGYLR